MPAAVQNKAQAKANGQAAPLRVVPFPRAAKEHLEAFFDESVQLDANSHQLGPIDVPAYGYARGIWVLVEATGGAGGANTVAAAADSPFNLFSTLQLNDVNSTPVFGPLSGYETYLADKWLGYFPGLADPRQDPDFSAVATGAGASGNFTFLLYIPLEISGRDALGALANLNGASTYKINATVAPQSDVYTTPPATTVPKARIRMYLDAWSQPPAADEDGNPVADEPPANGTTQYLSKQIFNFAASGNQTPQLSKMGNLIRGHLYIWRNAAGARVSASFPDPFTTYLDGVMLKAYNSKIWRKKMASRTGFHGVDEAAGALDTGVFVDDFAHDFDGKIGWELRDGWLQTKQSTRYNLQGDFGEAGTLTVITNDVSANGDVYVG